MVVVAVLNKGPAQDMALMHLLRCFAFYSAYFRFHFSAKHVPGVMNTAADALSRNNLPLFFSLAPQVPQFVIPAPLLELLLTTIPDWGSPSWTRLFSRSLTEVSAGQHEPPMSQERDAT